MQLILIDDVYGLGKRGQLVNVARGYGRNYLVPKGLAIAATKSNLKTIQQQRLSMAKKEASFFDEAQMLADELDQLHLLVSRKSGASGTLFGSVTGKDIVGLLKQEGIRLDRRKLILDHPLKSIGNYQLPVRTHSEVKALLLVSVLIEGDESIKRVKRKDQESDQIVAAINDKVKELGLNPEGRTVTERFAPQKEEGKAAQAAESAQVSEIVEAIESAVPEEETLAAEPAAEEAPTEEAAAEESGGEASEPAQEPED
ncbi:MAG: 50S ribosomal protein L9 [Acidobacteriota bacterium]